MTNSTSADITLEWRKLHNTVEWGQSKDCHSAVPIDKKINEQMLLPTPPLFTLNKEILVT